MKRILTFLLTCLIVFSGLSQNIDENKLNAYLDTLAANDKFMGSIAVSRNGKLIYERSVGFADLERGMKANENSKYRIGSISKTFTAVLVFKAFEENKLIPEQTIDKYFPAIINADKITIADLLYHRSGIHNFTDDESYFSWNTQPKTEEEIIEIIVAGGSDFEPDSKASYSNSNYVLLSYILEKIYGKDYAKLIEEKIVKPIGLKNTRLGFEINTEDNECNSYKYNDGWKIEPETDISIPKGAGGIVSTPVDLTLFAISLFNGNLISQSSLSRMKTLKDNYGQGLFQIPFYDQSGFGHTGGIDGFTSLFVYFPDDHIAFAYTANGLNYSGNDIAIAVLSAVFDKPFEIPCFKEYNVTSEELDKYSGVYSSKELPLKITITKKDEKLEGQATGQSAFPLRATKKATFVFEQAGIVMEFNSDDKTMVLKQNGGTYFFEKEE